MNDPSDWELLARYLSGECSDEEQAEVKALIASDPEKQRLIASMSSGGLLRIPIRGRPT